MLSPRAIALQGVGFGPRLAAVQGFGQISVVVQQPTQGAGAGANTWLEKTSRNSDPHAYDRDRVAKRLASIEIAGKLYDPMDLRLPALLEALAKRAEPEHADELVRQTRKLSRNFKVRTADGAEVIVPLIRSELNKMPDLKKALAADMKAYAEKTAVAAEDQRRRILILLAAGE